MAFKKCKYCGSRKIVFCESTFAYPVTKYWCICENCNNKTGEYCDKDSAFFAWNKENK